MFYTFEPKGVCSMQMNVEVDENRVIKNAEIIGGCPGNTVGVCKLVIGRTIDEVIPLLKGIPCRDKGTSCPDQLARGLEKIRDELGKKER